MDDHTTDDNENPGEGKPQPNPSTRQSQPLNNKNNQPKKEPTEGITEQLDRIGAKLFASTNAFLDENIPKVERSFDKFLVAMKEPGSKPPKKNPPLAVESAIGSTTTTNKTNMGNPGYYLDGWADIIEGMGNKVDDVRSDILIDFEYKDLPEVLISDSIGFIGMNPENRSYIIASTSPGANTLIYVGKHGTDLYASWKTFIRPVLNWGVVVLIFIIAIILGLVSGGIEQVGGDFFDSSMETILSISGWLRYSVILALFLGFLLGIAGRIFKGSYSAYFFVEPNLFDADDITAMSISAHKTLLRSLDSSGIDVSKLRLKQKFQGGRKGEEL